MFAKLRIEADVTLPEKREKAGGCVVTQWSSRFADAEGVPKTHVMNPSVGAKGTVLGTITVPTFWALFSAHLRRIIEMSNILPIFSGQKAGHVFVQVLVCLSSAPGYVLLPSPQAAAIRGWSNWLDVEAIRAGKELLLLNLDETPTPPDVPAHSGERHAPGPRPGLAASAAPAARSSRARASCCSWH